MARKIIAGKAAFLSAIRYPGYATRTHDDPDAHEVVRQVTSYIATSKANSQASNGSGNDDDDSDPSTHQGFRMAISARELIDQNFDAILNLERITFDYYTGAIKWARGRRFVSLRAYMVFRARLWAGGLVAESLISDVREAHLNNMERAVESLRKHMLRQRILKSEVFDPFGDQEDHINTHYRRSNSIHYP